MIRFVRSVIPVLAPATPLLPAANYFRFADFIFSI